MELTEKNHAVHVLNCLINYHEHLYGEEGAGDCYVRALKTALEYVESGKARPTEEDMKQSVAVLKGLKSFMGRVMLMLSAIGTIGGDGEMAQCKSTETYHLTELAINTVYLSAINIIIDKIEAGLLDFVE